MIKAIYVHPDLFGPPLTLGNLRMGDLIAACNFLEHIREDQNDPELRMYIPDESLFPANHVFKMRNWLLINTNYLTNFPDQLIKLDVIPGTDETYANMYNLWNIRKDVLDRKQNVFDIDDAVTLFAPSFPKKSRNYVICPLVDAPYNADRNWSLAYLQKELDKHYEDEGLYNEYIICSKEPIEGLQLGRFIYSHNFEENLKHIQECRVFVGGDTGMSHFASALNPRPDCWFHYPQSTYGTTNPFYWKTKGRMIYY